MLVIGSDGSGLKQIALSARAPAWSPDGRRLAYESGIDAYFEAGSATITRFDGSGSVQVKAINGFSDLGPVWSPAGSELAFQGQRTEGSPIGIYVVRADGRRKRRLALGHPAWSPDGGRLAFIDDYKLITIDRNGNGERRLSRKGEFVVGAAWSPKGGRLAFVAGTTAGRRGGGTEESSRRDRERGREASACARARDRRSLIWGAPVWTPNGKRILVAVEAH